MLTGNFVECGPLTRANDPRQENSQSICRSRWMGDGKGERKKKITNQQNQIYQSATHSVSNR